MILRHPHFIKVTLSSAVRIYGGPRGLVVLTYIYIYINDFSCSSFTVNVLRLCEVLWSHSLQLESFYCETAFMHFNTQQDNEMDSSCGSALLHVCERCVMIYRMSAGPHHVRPSSLQLPNQTRMENGPEVISQSSLLPMSGFPMQVRPIIISQSHACRG